jgi:ribonuclease P protein component
VLKKYSFPKSFRLREYKKIQALFSERRKKVIYPFVFHYAPSEKAKVMIAIPKKFGNAVRRNRLKRQIRAMLRLSFFRELKVICAIRIIIDNKTIGGKIPLDTIKNAIQNFIIFQKNN